MPDVHEFTSHGKTIRVEPQPGKIGKCWKLGRWYEADLLERIRTVTLQEGLAEGTAVDGGANFGNHTLFFSLVLGFRQVHAFEPIQWRVLRRQLALNPELLVWCEEDPDFWAEDHQDANVFLLPWALGAYAHRADTTGKGRLVPVGEGPYEVRTLDEEVIIPDVRLLKLDVEWFEPHALVGARDTIAQGRPVIFSECQPGEYEKQKAILQTLGYKSVGNTRSKGSSTPVVEWRFSS